jgi:hypothetical protein
MNVLVGKLTNCINLKVQVVPSLIYGGQNSSSLRPFQSTAKDVDEPPPKKIKRALLSVSSDEDDDDDILIANSYSRFPLQSMSQPSAKKSPVGSARDYERGIRKDADSLEAAREIENIFGALVEDDDEDDEQEDEEEMESGSYKGRDHRIVSGDYRIRLGPRVVRAESSESDEEDEDVLKALEETLSKIQNKVATSNAVDLSQSNNPASKVSKSKISVKKREKEGKHKSTALHSSSSASGPPLKSRAKPKCSVCQSEGHTKRFHNTEKEEVPLDAQSNSIDDTLVAVEGTASEVQNGEGLLSLLESTLSQIGNVPFSHQVPPGVQPPLQDQSEEEEEEDTLNALESLLTGSRGS